MAWRISAPYADVGAERETVVGDQPTVELQLGVRAGVHVIPGHLRVAASLGDLAGMAVRHAVGPPLAAPDLLEAEHRHVCLQRGRGDAVGDPRDRAAGRAEEVSLAWRPTICVERGEQPNSGRVIVPKAAGVASAGLNTAGASWALAMAFSKAD